MTQIMTGPIAIEQTVKSFGAGTGRPQAVEPRSRDTSLVHRNCPLCSDSNKQTRASRYSHPMWTLKRCRCCHFVYIDKAPPSAAFFSTMAWETTNAVNARRCATARPISFWGWRLTRSLLNHLPRGHTRQLLERVGAAGRVIDLACGDGRQVADLAARFTPFGTEISMQTASDAGEHVELRHGYILTDSWITGLRHFPEDYFTAATLAQLHHAVDPRAVLSALRRVLAPGGIVVMKVPNFDCFKRILLGRRWRGLCFPDHLNHFTAHTLRQMARGCGYRTEFAPTWRLLTNDSIWAVLTKP